MKKLKQCEDETENLETVDTVERERESSKQQRERRRQICSRKKDKIDFGNSCNINDSDYN